MGLEGRGERAAAPRQLLRLDRSGGRARWSRDQLGCVVRWEYGMWG